MWGSNTRLREQSFHLERAFGPAYRPNMSSAAIIEEILHLSPAGQAEVIQFALRLARERALAPDELAGLAQRMVDSDDLAEVEKLKSAIMRGFYGETAHA